MSHTDLSFGILIIKFANLLSQLLFPYLWHLIRSPATMSKSKPQGKPFLIPDIIIWLLLFILMFSDIIAGWYVKDIINKGDFRVKSVKVNVFTGKLIAKELNGIFSDSLTGITYSGKIAY